MTNKHLTLEQAQQLAKKLNQYSYTQTDLIAKDEGTCIRGEGIQVSVKLPKKRTVKNITVFENTYTQGSQELFLKKLINMAIEDDESLDGLISYKCGLMD